MRFRGGFLFFACTILYIEGLLLKILVLYYSRTGNTEKMAKAVAEGAKTAGDLQVDLNYFVEAGDLGDYDAICVGTPTYHHDMPIDIKTLFEEAASRGVNLKGKPGAVFGSFGWSGEAPKLVAEIMKNKFEMKLTENPLLSKYTPDQGMLEQCKALGKRVAESLIR
jgi:flavodoxin I